MDEFRDLWNGQTRLAAQADPIPPKPVAPKVAPAASLATEQPAPPHAIDQPPKVNPDPPHDPDPEPEPEPEPEPLTQPLPEPQPA